MRCVANNNKAMQRVYLTVDVTDVVATACAGDCSSIHIFRFVSDIRFLPIALFYLSTCNVVALLLRFVIIASYCF